METWKSNICSGRCLIFCVVGILGKNIGRGSCFLMGGLSYELKTRIIDDVSIIIYYYKDNEEIISFIYKIVLLCKYVR